MLIVVFCLLYVNINNHFSTELHKHQHLFFLLQWHHSLIKFYQAITILRLAIYLQHNIIKITSLTDHTPGILKDSIRSPPANSIILALTLSPKGMLIKYS
jgi:hypothetical protein